MNGINPMSLAGRTVLITGASQGIGLGVARLSADLGANLVLADMNAEGLEAACGHFAEDSILAAPGNVADPEFVETLVGILPAFPSGGGARPKKSRLQCASFCQTRRRSSRDKACP
jgi:NAD(P)-dependent dehydrogenase (short-subunit alcohol dehydrogenase family)